MMERSLRDASMSFDSDVIRLVKLTPVEAVVNNKILGLSHAGLTRTDCAYQDMVLEIVEWVNVDRFNHAALALAPVSLA